MQGEHDATDADEDEAPRVRVLAASVKTHKRSFAHIAEDSKPMTCISQNVILKSTRYQKPPLILLEILLLIVDASVQVQI